jgi:two-component system, NarL family, sensor histidine kinase UhpB
VLSVEDDGRGFDPLRVTTVSGIRGMRERALLVRARLEVDSAPGYGTTVRLRTPL